MWKAVRKFGLEYCDLPTMLWNVSVFLRLFTLNIDSRYKKGIPKLFYVVTTLSYCCYFYVYLFSVLWFAFVRSPQTGQSDAALKALSLGVPTEIATLKLLYMFLYIDKIRKLIDDFLEFDSQMFSDSRVSKNLLKYLRNVKKRAIIFWIFIMSIGLLFIMKHFIVPEHFTEESFVFYGLEPMHTSPNYEIGTSMLIVSTVLITGISANVTGFIIIMTGYTEAQLLALSDEVTQVWKDAQVYYETVKNLETEDGKDEDTKQRVMNQYVSDTLKGIITQHVIIKQFFFQVIDLLKGILGIGMSLLVVGLILDLLCGLDNTYLQLAFAFMQIGMDCFVGQRMKDAGVTFEQAVYFCEWENFNKENMKMVLIMLQNAQKIAVISAGDFVEVNYECLMATMKATYSTYTAFASRLKK